jgi:putative FmdB family regulatory protein
VIYEYKCPNCSVSSFTERSIHAEASTPSCADCGELMSRVWASPPVSFRGSGFYSNDK